MDNKDKTIVKLTMALEIATVSIKVLTSILADYMKKEQKQEQASLN